jgi:hypothetical protein
MPDGSVRLAGRTGCWRVRRAPASTRRCATSSPGVMADAGQQALCDGLGPTPLAALRAGARQRTGSRLPDSEVAWSDDLFGPSGCGSARSGAPLRRMRAGAHERRDNNEGRATMTKRISDRRIDRRAQCSAGSARMAAGPAGAGGLAAAADSVPVVISIMDVGGALALMQKAFEDYARRQSQAGLAHHLREGPAPELASKIKAQQDAGKLIYDLVLTGSDGLAAGMATRSSGTRSCRNMPTSSRASRPITSRPRLRLHKVQGDGFGVVINYYPSGPLLEYMPQGWRTRRRRPRSCWPGPRPIRTASCTPARPIPARAAPS